MVKINENYLKLKGNYLFAEIARRVEKFKNSKPEANIIKLGIGDVTRPLADATVGAMHKAVDEMAKAESFRGYGPEQGYDFLRDKIVEFEYKSKGLNISADEIFISDGSKCDTGNIQEIFGTDNRVAVTDPVYPVYIDTNVMAGRTGVNKDGRYENIIYLSCNAENNFVPELPSERADMIYFCYPNNPTGMTLSREQLKKWVDYAIEEKSVILYDAAYEAYIREDGIPHSIYEIEGARKVAIEFRSFSKNAAFTGTRCAYTVIPKDVMAYTIEGEAHPLNNLWNRRHSTKFNGVAYVIQRAAEAVFSDQGQKQINEIIDYYMTNAKIIRQGLENIGIKVFGGVNAPYIWLKTPNGLDSWEFFDKLLGEAHLVGTPGVGFGPSGQGYFRLTAFGNRENTEEAVERFRTKLNLE